MKKMNISFQEQLEAILTYAYEGIEAVDAQGNVIYINPAFTRITGIESNDRIGKNIFALNPGGVLARILTTRQPVVGVTTTAPGLGLEAVASGTPIYKDQEFMGAVIIVQDISEVITLSKKLMEQRTTLDNLLKRTGSTKYNFNDLAGESPAFTKTKSLAKRIAQSDSTVLILGESGVGKELFAHAIHAASLRREFPFIVVNCAAVPDGLLESEFFGHEQGAFTGAVKRKMGVFELAHRGSIFLDEIGELSLALQAKLLRVLQDKEFRRVGGIDVVKADVRIIAATNRNLEAMVQEGKFRKDLFYRLSVVPLHIPALRERKQDIPLLVSAFLEKVSRRLGRVYKSISDSALNLLMEHDWPGNIRELENVIEYALLSSINGFIEEEDVIPKLPFKDRLREESKRIRTIKEVEQELIERALNLYGHDVKGKKQAADALGISLGTLYNKLKDFKGPEV